MKYRKDIFGKVLLPAAVISMALVLQGCAAGVTPAETESLEDVLSRTPERVNTSFRDGSKELRIDAEVILPGAGKLSRVTLVHDSERAEAMAEELICSRFESYEHPEDGDWFVTDGETRRAHFESDTEMSGYSHYTDVAADIDAPYNDYDMMYLTNFYVTENQPEGMSLTPAEAAEKVEAYFGERSELDFKTFRMISAGGGDKPGFYNVWEQLIYRGVPVCPREGVEAANLHAIAYISDEKIYAFYGRFLLKTEKAEEISELVPLETVMGQLEKNFSTLSSDYNVTVDKISLEYYPTETSGGKFLLRPVWNFYGKTDEMVITTPGEWLFSYHADDGSLCYSGLLFF